MIIGSCGYGATGSSVLTDLLTEYDGIQVFDNFEFTISYRVDGIEDLEYHLMKQYAKNSSGDYAIKRFLDISKSYKTPFINKPCDGETFYRLSKKFIDEITQTTYKGMDTFDVLNGNILRNIFALASKKIFMPKLIEKITKKTSYVWPARTMYYSVEPSNFYEAAREYTSNIIESMGGNLNEKVVLDQPFEGNAPEQSFPFFEDPFAVVIDRDPRDLYLAGKYTKDPNFKFTPKDDVKKFIVYYKMMRKRRSIHKNVLNLNFEDFIYEYDRTVQKVEAFLSLGEHIRKKEVFEPSKSINNTQLIRLHPEDKKDIQEIENELPEFLYPFERYKSVEFNGRPFDGAARKMFEQ